MSVLKAKKLLEIPLDVRLKCCRIDANQRKVAINREIIIGNKTHNCTVYYCKQCGQYQLVEETYDRYYSVINEKFYGYTTRLGEITQYHEWDLIGELREAGILSKEELLRLLTPYFEQWVKQVEEAEQKTIRDYETNLLKEKQLLEELKKVQQDLGKRKSNE